MMPRSTEKLSGMFICGIVRDRRKRDIEKGEKKMQIVTYEVADDSGHVYYIEAFDPKDYYNRDAYVQIPVYIKAYKKKNGEPAYTINVKSESKNLQGESF